MKKHNSQHIWDKALMIMLMMTQPDPWRVIDANPKVRVWIESAKACRQMSPRDSHKKDKPQREKKIHGGNFYLLRYYF